YPGSCADAPPNQENRYFDCVIRHNKQFVKTKGFCTDVLFQQALGWIKAKKDAGKPFSAYITTNAQHGPMIAPEKYKKPFLDAGFDQQTAGRYGMIVNIDDNVGTLMEKMDAWGLWDNTLLIFMTDNGQASRRGMKNGKAHPLFAAGLRAGKGSPYEGGTRVPAFWRWKGVLAEGKDVDALTAHVDLFDTFAELAGAKVPPGTQKRDGRSMVPLLENPGAPWPDRYLFTHVGRWEKGADPEKSKYATCAVRNSRFRLVNNKELYDVKADPGETTNVIDKHPEVVKAMRTAYDAWWTEVVPMMVNEKVPLAEHRPYWVLYERQLAEGGI